MPTNSFHQPSSLRPYAGRWVALLHGRIAGVGETAEAARAAAQLARPREIPQVIYVPEHRPLDLPDLLADMRRILPPASDIWLVGGAIRDALLRRPVQDLDFVVAGEALAVARTLARAWRADFYPLDSERDVGRILLMRAGTLFTLDFARLRGSTLIADLAARDFTINAIAAPLANTEELLDPLGGELDLRARILRLCSPGAIADDPVRAVRAVRLAAQLDFHISRETRSAICADAASLSRVSAERRREEFIRCLGGRRPQAAVRALDMLGLLPYLIPVILPLKGVTQSPPHVLDVWEHSLAAVARLADVLAILGPEPDEERASDFALGLIATRLGRYRAALARHLDFAAAGGYQARGVLMLAALLHDIGKPTTRSVDAEGQIHFLEHERVGADLTAQCLADLRFSGAEISRAKTIVANHLRPAALAREPQVTRRAAYRFFRDTGAAGVETILLALADRLATYGGHPPPMDEWRRLVEVGAYLLETYFEKAEEVVAPPPFITGHDLMNELGIAAGPQIGELLEKVREAQAAGEITDRTAAIDYARRLAHFTQA